MQIYKIYVNEKPLILMSEQDSKRTDFTRDSTLFVRHSMKPKTIFQCLDSLEKGTKYDRIVLYAPSYPQLKSEVKAVFKIIKAGGGLVIDENGAGLFIHRRSHWDLPKGKLDPGEDYKIAAVREVEEETGITGLTRGKKILKTRHVYRTKSGKRILKLTNWYHMSANNQVLTPQAEEGIDQAVWLDPKDFMANNKPVFRSVVDVVEHYLNQQHI